MNDGGRGWGCITLDSGQRASLMSRSLSRDLKKRCLGKCSKKQECQGQRPEAGSLRKSRGGLLKLGWDVGIEERGGLRPTSLVDSLLSLLQGEESNIADGNWQPSNINPHIPDLVKPLLPIPRDLPVASAWPPPPPVVEQEVLQQQSPLSQARELEAELPEQGQVAHGEQAAGRGVWGWGNAVGRMVGRERKCEARQRQSQPECPN